MRISDWSSDVCSSDLFREAGLSADALNNILSLSMLAMGVGALISAIRIGPLGSGFLCPPVFTAFYLSPSLLALKAGGLPLVFGMTLFAGFVEAAIGRASCRERVCQYV